MTKKDDEYRRAMGMNMPTGEHKMADMQFTIRRPMQEERERKLLQEAYKLLRAGIVLGMADSEGGEL